MVQAIRFAKTGGPEVLEWQQVEVGKPGPGQVRLRHAAVGLNYIDTYQRSGLYPMPMPSGLGSEAAGVIEEVGPGVSGLKAGDRVAYAGGPLGAYSEARVMPADRLVPVPAGITDQEGAAMMLKGMTAWYLIRRTHVVKPGETILIHAAAGGVGLIVCQWAKHLGATVIGTVGDDEKAALAKKNGCDHAINYRREDFVARVNDITGGKKCPVVYDSVGKDTFFKSLDCIAPLGPALSRGLRNLTWAKPALPIAFAMIAPGEQGQDQVEARQVARPGPGRALDMHAGGFERRGEPGQDARPARSAQLAIGIRGQDRDA